MGFLFSFIFDFIFLHEPITYGLHILFCCSLTTLKANIVIILTILPHCTEHFVLAQNEPNSIYIGSFGILECLKETNNICMDSD